ncbi:MAG: ribonuclease HI family protein [Candidatus Aenigmarchaeota archaeon]|nr:ribonuclease HI family protein [Candidatus Aenigmarchaeota archaeon]
MTVTIYFDGCSKGNPGKAGYGYALYRDGKKVHEGNGVVPGGHATNNRAEFTAVLKALEFVNKADFRDAIEIKGDSKLVIEQLNGTYKVKSATSTEFVPRIKALIGGRDMKFIHIPREKNKEADALCNRAVKASRRRMVL